MPRLAVILFAVGSRRLVKGAGKNAREGLLGIKTILNADIKHLLIGITQLLGRQPQLALADIAPQTLAFVLHKQPLQMPF